MKFQQFSFGKIRIDGIEYCYDIVIDRGRDSRAQEETIEAVPGQFRSHAALFGRGDTVEMQSFGGGHGHWSTASDG